MYELMTLQQIPPKDVDAYEFNCDIKDGVRPSFLEEVVVPWCRYFFIHFYIYDTELL